MSQGQGRGQELALTLARLARLVPLARVARLPANRRMRSVSG